MSGVIEFGQEGRRVEILDVIYKQPNGNTVIDFYVNDDRILYYNLKMKSMAIMKFLFDLLTF